MQRLLLTVLVVPLALLATGSSCAGPQADGAFGLVVDGDRLGIVTTPDADGFGGLWRDRDDVEVEGPVDVRWTRDGRVVEEVTRVEPEGGSHQVAPGAGPLPDADELATWAPCLDVPCTADEQWVPDGADAGPVPAGRRALVLGAVTGCRVSGAAGVLDQEVHPATGELVVAMGRDGVAVRDADGRWERVAVGPFAPTPLTLADGPGVLRHLAVYGVPALFVAALTLWALVALARTRQRAEGDRLAWSLLVVPLGAVAAVGVVGVGLLWVLFLAGVTVLLIGLAVLLGVPVVAAALVAGRRLPAEQARACTTAASVGGATGLAVAALWVVGAPGPWLAWVLASVVAVPVVAVPRLRRPRVPTAQVAPEVA